MLPLCSQPAPSASGKVPLGAACRPTSVCGAAIGPHWLSVSLSLSPASFARRLAGGRASGRPASQSASRPAASSAAPVAFGAECAILFGRRQRQNWPPLERTLSAQLGPKLAQIQAGPARPARPQLSWAKSSSAQLSSGRAKLGPKTAASCGADRRASAQTVGGPS